VRAAVCSVCAWRSASIYCHCSSKGIRGSRVASCVPSRSTNHDPLNHTDFFLRRRMLLFIRVLENHVFLDPEIERSIAARVVVYRRCSAACLSQLCITKQFFRRCSRSRDLGREQGIQPSLGFPYLRGSVAHPRALLGTIQASFLSRVNEHSEQARAPYTNGPRDVPRCGALSLLQKTLHYKGR
jgi:hypothetical protein